MNTEKIDLKPEYLPLGAELGRYVLEAAEGRPRFVVAVAGESGSGKSVAARSVAAHLEQAGRKPWVLSMDNYFHLPPHQNHKAREADLTHVGPQEVNLARLQEHLDAFVAGQGLITLPLTNYAEDRFDEAVADTRPYDVLILEGTYVFRLQGIDLRIFMLRDYRQTVEQRRRRGRDAESDFVEQVLAIEHPIIQAMGAQAQLVVDLDYRVRPNTP